MKKSPLANAKKKAWDAFSLFIRTRDSIKTTGTLTRCICITCNREYPTRGIGCIQAGHFIAGRNNAVLFSEQGVHGQCGICNNGARLRSKGSKYAPIFYYQFLLKEYGQEVIDRLILESNQIIKYKIRDFQEKEKEYKLKTQALLNNFIRSSVMPDKLVRVKADKHIKLKKRAVKNKRTVPTELDVILEKELK